MDHCLNSVGQHWVPYVCFPFAPGDFGTRYPFVCAGPQCRLCLAPGLYSLTGVWAVRAWADGRGILVRTVLAWAKRVVLLHSMPWYLCDVGLVDWTFGNWFGGEDGIASFGSLDDTLEIRAMCLLRLHAMGGYSVVLSRPTVVVVQRGRRAEAVGSWDCRRLSPCVSCVPSAWFWSRCAPRMVDIW